MAKAFEGLNPNDLIELATEFAKTVSDLACDQDPRTVLHTLLQIRMDDPIPVTIEPDVDEERIGAITAADISGITGLSSSEVDRKLDLLAQAGWIGQHAVNGFKKFTLQAPLTPKQYSV